MTDFDPATATTATTREQAVELARAWADGRRSWAKTIERFGHSGYAEGHSQRCTTAVLDAQEVIKWTAMAAVLPGEEAT